MSKAVAEFSVLDEKLRSKSIKALKALKAHLEAEGSAKGPNEPIYITFNTRSPTSKTREFVPRILPVKSRLNKPADLKILLITKDPIMTYRQPIVEKRSVTEDTFDQIMTFKKFKKIVSNSKSATKLYHEYDLVLIDHRLNSILLPVIAKTIFVKNNKKYPIMIQMAKPAFDAKLVKSKRSDKLKDERVEPEYIMRQVKSICKNTTFVPSTGTFLSIVIGYASFSVEQLLVNIDSVLKYLIDEQFQPIGGIIKGGLKGIEDMHVKSSESISLPILEKS